MQILTTTPYYEPEGGGLERYAHEIQRRLVSRGHAVHSFAFTRQGASRASHDGVQVDRRKASLTLGNAPIARGFARQLAKAIDALAPDVVVAHSPVPFPAETAFRAARRARVPFVLTYHAGRLRGSSLALDGLAAVHRATFERRMIRGSTRLVAVTPYVREHALRARREDVTIVPPGVDLGRFRPHAAPPEDEILFVGPLSSNYRWKGIDTLWRAYRLISKRRPATRLTLIGDGDRREAFHHKARAMGARVTLPGRVSDDALVMHYRRAAVTVLPSTSDAESFGMVLAEANACGRPVIGSDIGGIPDFITHGDNGLLAQPGDEHDLAQRIEEVLDDPAEARRMGARGRAKVTAHHDWERLAARTEEVLRNAASPA